MSRSPLVVRPAVAADVPVLREIWEDILRRGDVEEQLADVAAVLDRAADSLDCQVVVATYDGDVAGAVYLEASTLTPLNLEPTVLAVSPHVLPAFRRKGVGTALMDAAVRFAEQRGIPTIASAANSGGRDANRFMARLALAPHATLRAATTSAVRARITATAPRLVGAGSRIERVLAARRTSRERVAG